MLVVGCTDIIQTEGQELSTSLVVEGTVSNADEPYLVKLSTTSNLSGIGQNELGAGAEVVIRSQNSGQVTLKEIEPGGLYSTEGSSFAGQIGESYQLYIKLANGEEFESPFEEIRPPVVILDALAEVREEPTNTVFGSNFFHDISIEVANNPDQLEFFSVDISGIAEVSIEYGSVLVFGGPNPCVPPGIELPQICYAIRDTISNEIILGNNAQIGNPSYFVDVFSVPADFNLRYLAQLRANTISEQAHQYLTTITEQLDREGTIFDSPLPALIGNVKNIRTNERAQGYFFAASVTNSQVCFDRSLINFEFTIPEICALTGPGDCVEHWSPAIFEAPEGFQLCL